MAATIAEIREKLNRYSDSNSKVPHVFSPYQNSHYCNFEPFSQKKTKNSLEDIFIKLMRQYKSTHNRKYLQSFFPYYVFLDSIFDIDGKIVLKIHKEKPPGGAYSNRYVLEVTRDFYDKYSTQLINFLPAIGGANINVDYRPRIVIHDGIDDIFFLYNKEYTFKNIAQRKEFKEILLNKINGKFIYKKEVHLQGLPF
jgi:hypothetical protein